jgi:hypothetical protein
MPKPAPTNPPMATPAVPAPSANALVNMTKALSTARSALAARQLDEAKTHIRVAKNIAQAPEHQALVERLELLHEHVVEFWDAVRDGLKGLANVSEMEFNGNPMSIVEATADHLKVRYRGRNLTYERLNIPTGLAMTIADRAWEPNGAAAKVAKGALLAVDPNGNVDQARRLWQEAALAGGEVDKLLPVLDDKYDLKRLPVAKATPKQGPIPDRKLQDEAVKQIRDRFKAEFAAAKKREEKFELAKRLLDEALLPVDSDAQRYALLSEAREIAASAKLAQLLMQIVDETETWFTIDALTVKSEALTKAAVRATAGIAKEIAFEALQLVDQAVESKRMDVAQRLVGVAIGAARGARDTELSKRAVDKRVEIQNLLKEKKAPEKDAKSTAGAGAKKDEA